MRVCDLIIVLISVVNEYKIQHLALNYRTGKLSIKLGITTCNTDAVQFSHKIQPYNCIISFVNIICD